MNNGDRVYYARILEPVGIYEVCDLKVRSVGDTWFSATDSKTKQAFMFNNKDIGNTIFTDRNEALKKVKEAEKNKKKVSEEVYYEEY